MFCLTNLLAKYVILLVQNGIKLQIYECILKNIKREDGLKADSFTCICSVLSYTIICVGTWYKNSNIPTRQIGFSAYMR